MKQEFLKQNREKFQKKMEEGSIALMHSNTVYTSSADMHFPFEPDRDFYYLTGLKLPDFLYLAEKSQGEVKETLFVYRKDEQEEKWTGYRYTKEELTDMCGMTNIAYLDQFQNYLASSMAKNSYKTAYLNTPLTTTWKTYISPQETLAKQVVEKYPYLQIKHSSEIMVSLRVIKEPYEVEQIRRAAEITDRGLRHMMRISRGGINEKELEAAFCYEVIQAGAMMSFPPIIASGKNALVLHYDSNDNVVEDDSLVLADVGAAKKYYCADVTRTFPAGGKFNEIQRKIYEIVLEANEKAIGCIKEGITLTEIDQCAQEVLYKGLKELNILETKDELRQYYYHSIGHSLGLDAHDSLNRTMPLKAGMVITIEPGLYVEQLGIGVRIEDDVLVTEAGYDVLTKQIMKNADEIEQFMQKEQKRC